MLSFLSLCCHLLAYDNLILVLHLVQAICLQVIHEDAKAAHNFSLLIDLGF